MGCNGNCAGCTGGCNSCGGCGWAGDLVLTKPEMDFLQELGQVAFLPVARTMGDLTPVYLEAGEECREEYSRVLLCLEKKGLISLDYDKPLKDYHTPAYDASPVRGSMALTKRGQDVLELMEYQGVR